MQYPKTPLLQYIVQHQVTRIFPFILINHSICLPIDPLFATTIAVFI